MNATPVQGAVMGHPVFDTETELGLEDGTLMSENTASSFFVLEVIVTR